MSFIMKRYNPSEIEPKWQEIWDEQQAFKAQDASQKPKYYALTMFPYPSGIGLHIGHLRPFTTNDANARFRRMQGYEVLNPMGWDNFGLPAENYAVKTGTPPQITTRQNTDNFRVQAKHLGYSFDWSREFGTSDPSYYKWTQWFFLLLYKRGLAYRRESAQFWCNECKTVLANEQVVNGCCWRHEDLPVAKKSLKQWFFKITDYAERLEADLEGIDWPGSIKTMQRNWIGRSKGAEVSFDVQTPFTKVVLMHGKDKTAQDIWYPWLGGQAEKAGLQYVAPKLTTVEVPELSEWLAGLDAAKPDENTVLVGHSRGGMAILRWLERLPAGRRVGKVVLVAANAAHQPDKAGGDFFSDEDYDFKKIRQHCSQFVVIHSKDDPWVPFTAGEHNAHGLGAQFVAYEDKAHFGGHMKDAPEILEHILPRIRIFTTRPDTLFGATFMALAPEHPLALAISSPEQKAVVQAYIREAQTKTDIDRMDENREKTGVFTGAYVTNPVNGAKIPVWVSDYVLMGYGTGAIMACPAHDERDYEFAKKFNLPVIEVLEPETGTPQQNPEFRRSIVAVVRNPKTQEVLTLDWGKLGGHLFVGGGREAHEDIVDAAVREIAEETGYTNLKLVAQTGKIHHNYFAASKNTPRRIEAHGLLFDLIDGTRTDEKLEAEEKGKFTAVWLPAHEAEPRIADELHATVFKLLVKGERYHGEGIMVNSGPYNGLASSETREKIVADLQAKGFGQEKVNFKLRDWLISRQRYWGAPIPIVHCPKDGIVPVPEDQLPIELPAMEDFHPTGDGRSPLAKNRAWVEVACPKCGGKAERETDTMDGFACSSWYAMRFADPHNDAEAFSKKLVEEWLPADMYIGGAEHAVMHLLYARMWTKVMYDAGLITFGEPFKALRNQGMLVAPDGQKFAKSKGNGVDPEEIINSGYGADALRTTILFLAPFDQKTPWSPEGLGGVYRFLNRIWTLAQEVTEATAEPANVQSDDTPLKQAVHKTIKKVTADMHGLGYNTAIAAQMELVNTLYKLRADIPMTTYNQSWRWAVRTLAQLAAPFAPHMAEELWQQLGGQGLVAHSDWPVWDESLTRGQSLVIAVQVNGKLRATLSMPADVSQEEVEKAALAEENVQKFVGNKKPARIIYVPARLLNIVVG